LFSLNSKATLSGCTVSYSKANIGGAIYSSNGSKFVSQNSNYDHLTAKENSGILFAYFSTIEITGSIFDTFDRAGIITDLIEKI
jgi:hypothetical protein